MHPTRPSLSLDINSNRFACSRMTTKSCFLGDHELDSLYQISQSHQKPQHAFIQTCIFSQSVFSKGHFAIFHVVRQSLNDSATQQTEAQVPALTSDQRATTNPINEAESRLRDSAPTCFLRQSSDLVTAPLSNIRHGVRVSVTFLSIADSRDHSFAYVWNGQNTMAFACIAAVSGSACCVCVCVELLVFEMPGR